MSRSLLVAGWGELPEAMSKLASALGGVSSVESALSFFPGEFSGSEKLPLTSVVENLAAKLRSFGSQPVSIVGWSLGGMLALELAEVYPELVAEMILLSPTASFVNREPEENLGPWEFGVELDSLDNFQENVEQDSERVLLGTYRSAGHKEESAYARAVIENFQNRFGVGLEYLRHTDIRSRLSRITVPTIVFHGIKDRTIPWEAGCAVAESIPGAIFCPLPGFGHALPKTAFEQIARAVKLWRDIRSGSGREVTRCLSYESEAVPQASIAQELVSMLPDRFVPKSFIDLGCGTGKLGRLVQEKYPQVRSLFVDSDLSALSYLSVNTSFQLSSSSIVCSDAHEFAVAKEVDLVVSASALQWMDNYRGLFSSLLPVVSSSGLLAFSLMIDGSLSGLRELRSELFPAKMPTRSFPTAEQVLIAAKDSDLEILEVKTGVVSEYFEGAIQAFSWLSRLGFNRSNYGKASMVVPAESDAQNNRGSFAGEVSKRLSRKELAVLSEHYNSRYSDPRGCPLEFCVLWFIAAKTAP